MATIGDSLTNPQSGYVRYEIGSSKTSYNINFDYISTSGNFFWGSDAYGLYSAIGEVGTMAYIKIKNTSKFRVLLCLPSSGNASQFYTDNMVVEINGTKYTTNLQTNTSRSVVNYYLAVDVTGLSKDTTYIVKIYSEPTENDNSSGRFNIQAIDVDTNAIVGFNLSMCNMFKGCTSLTQDIIIPSKADLVVDMFKGCTSMTHIHSNWNKSYNNEITPTGCYSGCTAITHIDDENVISYEGDLGIDYVPTEWGGNGFTEEITSIFEVEIPSDGYTISFSGGGESIMTNWGDSIKDSSISHTYSSSGTYIIKTKTEILGTGVGGLYFRDVLTKIIKLRRNPNFLFRECKKLTSINLNNCELPSRLLYNSFGNVVKMSMINTKLPNDTTNLFYVGSSGSEKPSNLSKIIGIEDLDVSHVKIFANLFKGFNGLTSLDLSAWNVSNATNMNNMFMGCSSLTSLNLSGWDVSNVTSMTYMFNEVHYLSELNLSTWIDNKTKAKDLSNFFSCNNGSTINEGSFIAISLPSIKINSAYGMFNFNKHIENIDFTNIDFSECENIHGICSNCSYLQTATFGSNNNYDNVTDISEAFYNCSKLTYTNLMEVL